MQQDSLDIRLMERIAVGNQRAFADLVHRHLPKAHAIARRMLYSPQDAEEAVQDAFGKVWVNAAGFDSSKAAFGTWFYRILANTCIDVSRRRPAASVNLESLMDTLSDNAPMPDEIVSSKMESQRIRQAVQLLPEKQRMAVILCYFEDLTNPQAAEAMGLHIKALEGLLVRARKALRQVL